MAAREQFQHNSTVPHPLRKLCLDGKGRRKGRAKMGGRHGMSGRESVREPEPEAGQDRQAWRGSQTLPREVAADMADMAAVGGLNPRQGYCCSVAAAAAAARLLLPPLLLLLLPSAVDAVTCIRQLVRLLPGPSGHSSTALLFLLVCACAVKETLRHA